MRIVKLFLATVFVCGISFAQPPLNYPPSSGAAADPLTVLGPASVCQAHPLSPNEDGEAYLPVPLLLTETSLMCSLLYMYVEPNQSWAELTSLPGNSLSFFATDAVEGPGLPTPGGKVSISAGNAAPSTDTDGAARGGDLELHAGGSARLNSGDENGGDISLVPGSGVGTGRSGNVVIATGNLTGPSGGFSIIGGTGATDDLILDGSAGTAGSVTVSEAGIMYPSGGYAYPDFGTSAAPWWSVKTRVVDASGTSATFGNGGSTGPAGTYMGDGISWEGSSSDTNELFLTLTNPTADRTITLPDATGTVALLEGLNSYTGKSTFTATPTGATVSDGSVYINPASMAAGESTAWTYEAGWSFTGMAGGGVTPSFGDLDGDGDKDLITGGDSGDVYAYKNTGTALSPAWTREAGWDIADIGERSAPTLGDLDGDGDLDLMMGEKNEIYGYKNTGSTSAPTWTAEATWNIVTTNGHQPKPTLVDMDGDGDLDIGFSTLYSYGITWYKNTGSAAAPAWTSDTAWNYANAYQKLAFADLDGDGDLDMLYGRDSIINAVKNNGTVNAPTWDVYTGWNNNVNREFVALVDLDSDGDADTIAGQDGGSTTVSGYRNTGSLGAAGNTLFGVAVGGTQKMRVGGLATDITGQVNVTGSVYSTGSLILEGSSADDYELTLAATNPTADRTITLPDATGTVVLNVRVVTPDIDGETTTLANSATVWTNTGDGDGEAISLLNDPTVGTNYCFAVDVAQTITVAPSTGETLYYGTDQCVVSLTSNAIGSTLCVVAITGGSGAKWFTMSSMGSWTCND